MYMILFLLFCETICAFSSKIRRVRRNPRVLAEKDGSGNCPVSMTFKRYRIDISSDKELDGEPKLNIFSSWILFINRSALERKYRTELINDCYDWIDLSGQSSSIIKAISTSKIFWTAVDRVSSPTFDPTFRKIISFPYSSMLCVRRLVDIANWLELEMAHGSMVFVDTKVSTVSVSLDVDAPIPTVILRKSHYSNLPRTTSSDATIETASITTKDTVVRRMKSWCDRILVKRSICPFTKSSTKSGQGLADVGVPVANIAYHYSSASPRKGQYALLIAEVFEAIHDMVVAGPSGKNGVSSILFSAPEFDDSFELWAGPIFAMLESNIIATSSEQALGVVCFHPKYATNDGKSFPGFGHMHSVPRLRKWVLENDETLSRSLTDEDIAAGGAWQRRTPHATINVLRADQLAAAETKRATPILYTDNIRTLSEVGWDHLQNELNNERRLN